MDAKDLLWFSSGFRTVEAWRDAMCAHGYRVPVHLCHGLHEAMQYLDLTFPAAFRLLWVNGKISVNRACPRLRFLDLRPVGSRKAARKHATCGLDPTGCRVGPRCAGAEPHRASRWVRAGQRVVAGVNARSFR